MTVHASSTPLRAGWEQQHQVDTACCVFIPDRVLVMILPTAARAPRPTHAGVVREQRQTLFLCFPVGAYSLVLLLLSILSHAPTVMAGGLNIEGNEITAEDCAMPDLRCAERYTRWVHCLQDPGLKDSNQSEKEQACQGPIDGLKKCQTMCSARDAPFHFDDYSSIWSNQTVLDELDGARRADGYTQFLGSRTTPGQAFHSVCRQCAFDHGEFVTFLDHNESYVDETARTAPPVIANARHTVLTPVSETCEIKPTFRFSKDPFGPSTCTRRVTVPTFVLFSWNLQNVFHLYADLVLPMMAVLKRRYGERIPNDILIFVQPCHLWQSCRPLRILRGDFDPGQDGAVSILKKLAGGRLPVFAKSQLELLEGTTCFLDLNLGVDFTGTSLLYGMKRSITDGPHAALMNLEDPTHLEEVIGIFENQRWGMKRVLNMLMPLMNGIPPSRPDRVVVVERTGTREVLNQQALNDIIDMVLEQNEHKWKGLPMSRENVRLETMPFTKQVALFQKTAVLITVHGQASANAVFMPQDLQSSLLLIMPKMWFGWRWLYANMALSTGVHVVMYRRPEDSDTDGYDGTGTNDLHNPERDANLTLSKTIFRASLVSAVRLVGGKVNAMHEAFIGEMGKDVGLTKEHLPLCLGCHV